MFLITGANGFIGHSLVEYLLSRGQQVVAPVRCKITHGKFDCSNFSWMSLGSFNQQTNWLPVLNNVKSVVHCAARAHVKHEEFSDVLAAYREVNVDVTLRLARQSAEAGVKRFVFLSSIGVHGIQNSMPFTEDSALNPHDAYSISKLEAERALFAVAKQSGMEVVIIRPPLVYGPQVPGNLASLIQWVQRGFPLPLGAVHNKRSLVAIENLVSFVAACSDRTISPQAANQVFVVADGEDVSTTTLLRKIAQAANRPSRLLSIPVWMLRAGATLLGKQTMADRLLGSLQVDASKARLLLGWQPVVTMDEQLTRMFKHKD
jgi:nucleoside-diphosphate-sugar epimerase